MRRAIQHTDLAPPITAPPIATDRSSIRRAAVGVTPGSAHGAELGTLGFMFLGVALYRTGIVQGRRDDAYCRRLAGWGLGIGIAITSAGMAWRVVGDWSADAAISGTIPTELGTIPMALGYLAVIILWSRSGSRSVERVGRVGQMALTNSLTQAIIGLATFRWIVGVWALQPWWSPRWLAHFRYGPFEWAWRCATCRSWQPLRRDR